MLGGILFIIVEKPYYLTAILIFMMIYVVNIPLPGPLDARGLLLLLLIIRLLFFDRENFAFITNGLFRQPLFHLILVFLLLTFIITFSNEESLIKTLKDPLLSLISLLFGFLLLSNKNGRNAFMVGLMTAGIVSAFDLILHYSIGGFMSERLIIKEELAIIRPLDYFITRDAQWGVNHNFPGFICGTAFIFVYIHFYRKIWKKTIALPLFLVLGAGVFLSTSRSTILSVIVALIFISFSYQHIKFNVRKVVLTGITILLLYISFYFVYNLFIKPGATDKDLVNVIYYRLYEEPFQIIGVGTQKYDIYSGERRETSATFRMGKATTDLKRFFSKDLITQLFGYGSGGYKHFGQRIFQDEDNSYVLDPHNGYVMLLVESGLVGFFIFLVFSISLIVRSIRVNIRNPLDMPIFYFFVMLMIYVIGQNGELTQTFSFLLIGGMIANFTNIYSETEETSEYELQEETEMIESK